MGYKLKRIMMWVNNTTRGLPAEYQEVEYVESSGSQYIDTGWYPTGTCEVEAHFYVNSVSDNGIFGVDSGWLTNSCEIFRDRVFVYGTQTARPTTTIVLQNNTEYTIKFHDYKEYLNNVLDYTFSAETFTSSYSAYVFAKRRNNNIESWASIKLYSLKLWNNSLLERDFVPCYRKSDSVIGLYDLVNNTFYTNSGTGTFTKGSDVPDMVEKQVRPSGGGGWQPGANTVLYCPLKDDILDHSGNHTMTMTTSTYGTVAKDSTGFYYFNGGYISSEAYSGPITAGTLSTWVKKSSSKSGGDSRFTWSVSAHYSGSSPFHCGLAFNFGGYGGRDGAFNAGATSGTRGKSISGPTMGSWELWTMTYDNTVGAKFYRNGTYESSFSNTNNLINDSLPTFIGATNPYTDQYLDGYLSDVIIEDKARTAQEVTDYYNLTKGNYGL